MGSSRRVVRPVHISLDMLADYLLQGDLTFNISLNIEFVI